MAVQRTSEGRAFKKAEFYGLSTDVKPVNGAGVDLIHVGSTFFEVNTGNVFIFDEVGNVWYPL